MPDEKICAMLRKLLAALLRKTWGKDLDAILSARGQELWLLGLDSTNKKFIDICGTVEPEILADIQSRGFSNTDAGYKANAQGVLPLRDKKADIFLLNTVHYTGGPGRLDPLVVHELAHLLEQIGDAPKPEGNDEANAEAIINSLAPNLLTSHPKEWALHLAAGGRVLIEKKQTPHKTIRQFLEVAIPSYDRVDDIRAKKGP